MIEVRELEKKYGSFTAVKGISFQVEKGEILGFLGPNGAGKSTTMKMLTCFIQPTAGTALVHGKDILKDSLEVRQMIGYLPESAPSYQSMTVFEFLQFIAETRGYDEKESIERTARIMELTSLNEVKNQTIETLSKGYRQRVGFAQALIHDPPVLILDEPTDGLDPNQKHEVRELIRRISKDKIIILSTHILEEMEAVCSRAIIINEGRIVADALPSELIQQSEVHNSIRFERSEPLTEGETEKIKSFESVIKLEQVENDQGQNAYRVYPAEQKNILSEFASFLSQNQIAVEDLQLEKGRLDEVFRKITMQEGESQ